MRQDVPQMDLAYSKWECLRAFANDRLLNHLGRLATAAVSTRISQNTAQGKYDTSTSPRMLMLLAMPQHTRTCPSAVLRRAGWNLEPFTHPGQLLGCCSCGILRQ
eukprot:2237802-Amphidinium_carterae.1